MDLGNPRVDELAAAVRTEAASSGRVVELTGAELRSRWESVVLRADGWIYRFPRPGVDFDRELAILRRLRGRLPVPIPEPEWVGISTPFMAYRRLEGEAFDPLAYHRGQTLERDRLADSLASFLVAMHTALTPEEALELRLPGAADDTADDTTSDGDLDRIATRIDASGATSTVVRAYVSTLLDQVREHRGRSGAATRVVLHDDFNVSNLALTSPAGELAAVWDFSCVRVGEPAADLRYLIQESFDLFDRVLLSYQRATGLQLDPRTAVLAHRLEVVSDAIDLGDLSVLEDRVRSWRSEGNQLR